MHLLVYRWMIFDFVKWTNRVLVFLFPFSATFNFLTEYKCVRRLWKITFRLSWGISNPTRTTFFKGSQAPPWQPLKSIVETTSRPQFRKLSRGDRREIILDRWREGRSLAKRARKTSEWLLSKEEEAYLLGAYSAMSSVEQLIHSGTLARTYDIFVHMAYRYRTYGSRQCVSSDRSHVEADCHVGIGSELTGDEATRSTKRTKTSRPIN